MGPVEKLCAMMTVILSFYVYLVSKQELSKLKDEPSLSSAVKSMLHDEHSKRLADLEQLIVMHGKLITNLLERVATIESTLAQWQATVWAKQIEQRVATLEQVTAGPPEGPGFGQLEQRMAALEQMADILNLKESIFKRVAALEELCAGCKEANELIESMPLPREG